MARAALDAVRPARLVTRALARDAGLVAERRFAAIAAGKAARGMLEGVCEAGRGWCEAAVVATSGSVPDAGLDVGRTTWFEAGHPTPDDNSARAGVAALSLARELDRDGLLVVLLSGGASAQLACPASGLTPGDKAVATRELLRAGAAIHELNTVRKHLSAVKGGRLAAANAGRTVTLALSDVADDDPSVIGSGPTVPDPTTFAGALDVLARLGVAGTIPRAVVLHLEAGAEGRVAETPKTGDPRLSRSTWRLVGSRRDAMRAAASAAAGRGYDSTVLDEPLVGEASAAGPVLVARARAAARTLRRPACVVSSGETVVHVAGDGIGGRNQEVALSAIRALEAADGPIALASVGTDGVDGPTDAAGAIADSTTLSRAHGLGLAPPEWWLARNDAYRFFAALGDLVVTGPTGTNVADLQVVLLA